MKLRAICESMAGGMELAAGGAIALCRGNGMSSVNLEQISNHMDSLGQPSEPGMLRQVLGDMGLVPDAEGDISLDGGGGMEEPMEPMPAEGEGGEESAFGAEFDAEGAEGGMDGGMGGMAGAGMGGGEPMGLAPDVDADEFSIDGNAVNKMAHKQMHKNFGSRGR